MQLSLHTGKQDQEKLILCMVTSKMEFQLILVSFLKYFPVYSSRLEHAKKELMQCLYLFCKYTMRKFWICLILLPP